MFYFFLIWTKAEKEYVLSTMKVMCPSEYQAVKNTNFTHTIGSEEKTDHIVFSLVCTMSDHFSSAFGNSFHFAEKETCMFPFL